MGRGEPEGKRVSQSSRGAVKSKRMLVWKLEEKQNRTKQNAGISCGLEEDGLQRGLYSKCCDVY